MLERLSEGSQIRRGEEGHSVPKRAIPDRAIPQQTVPKREEAGPGATREIPRPAGESAGLRDDAIGWAVPDRAIPQQAVPEREKSGLVVAPEASDLADVPDRDVDLDALRARLRVLIREKLFASPMMQKMYADLVIASAPESEEAKLLARNYQKLIDRITMANSKSCTHIKVDGVRCESPALRGEQFGYFHQHAHRGVRRPARSRLHPIALIESEEAIQASLMEVINGLLRNTLDVKRAELILRALHIAVKNARNVKFDSEVYPKVREVPEYAAPEPKTVPDAADGVSTPEPELDMPYTAAIPLQPSREERAEREHQAKIELERARQATIRAELARAGRAVANGNFSPVSRSQTVPVQRTPRSSQAGNTTVDPTKPKRPVSVKAKSMTPQRVAAQS